MNDHKPQAQAGKPRQTQDDKQRAQAGKPRQTQAGNRQRAGNGDWQRHGKHVRRIAKTGLDTAQAAEIVDAQREVACEAVSKATEKFVTREHFDSAVSNLKEYVDLRAKGLEGKMQVLIWFVGILAALQVATVVSLLAG